MFKRFAFAAVAATALGWAATAEAAPPYGTSSGQTIGGLVSPTGRTITSGVDTSLVGFRSRAYSPYRYGYRPPITRYYRPPVGVYRPYASPFARPYYRPYYSNSLYRPYGYSRPSSLYRYGYRPGFGLYFGF